MTKFRFYIMDEDYGLVGTNSEELALKYADAGCTVLDTATAKYGDNTDQLDDFVEVDEATNLDEGDEEDGV